jgi:hypothetical protein
MDVAKVRSLLLAMDGFTEHDHFGKAAYRIANTKGKPSNIFLTLWIEERRAVLMLDREQQAELHARHPEAFFPVPNKWGEKGATFVELDLVNERLFRQGVDEAVSRALGK